MVCFVPGCKSGNSSREKSHLMKISKQAPAEIKSIWTRNIPKQVNKVFSFTNHHLCHHHFEDRFLVKSFTVKMGETVIAQQPRARWKLTDDAIPTLFSNCTVPHYFNKKVNLRPPPKVRHMEVCEPPQKPKKDLTSDMDSGAGDNSDSSGNVIRCCILDPGCNVEIPSSWIRLSMTDSMEFLKLAKDDKQILPTFHSERTIFATNTAVVHIRTQVIDELSGPVNSVDEISALLKRVDEMPICPGIVTCNMIQECDQAYRCGNSWISKDCSPNNLGNVCERCQDIGIKLRKLADAKLREGNPKLQNTESDTKRPKKKTLSRALTRLKDRLSKQRVSLKLIRLKFAKLDTPKLEAAINEEDNLTPQMKAGLLAAAMVAKSTSKYGVRYQPDWILQSILLKICSPKAYRHLRDNQILPLPHPQHLTSLLKGLPCQFGFNDFVFQNLGKEFQTKPKKDRQFMLIFDEMKIRESISFDKTWKRFHGYIDYGDFAFDRKGARSKKIEADHVLVFMCRCLNSKLTQPIASFATRGSAPGTILAKMIISCIAKLEEVSCEIVGIISDGATNNKSAWKALGLSGQLQSVINKIPNPCDESRDVHFLCDMPHIVKCIRNFIHKEGVVKFSGNSVNWGYYKALYEVDKQNDIRVAHKLSGPHINPNPFQKMVVSYATQIFSKSVADGIKFYRDEMQNRFFKDSEGTEDFTRKINDLFDACNSRIPIEGITRNSKSYRVILDFLNNLTALDTFASSVTMASIRVTLRSIIDLVDYLCDVIGFNYVLTAKLNQDCLENFFGLLRSYGGDDCHPTALSFSHLFRLLSIYMPSAKTLKGNVRTEEYSVVSYLDSLKSLRKVSDNKKSQLADEHDEQLLAKIICSDDLSANTELNSEGSSSLDSIVYHLCGYLVYKSKTFTKCEDCLRSLEDPSPDTHNSSLTKIKDFGGLTYPSKILFGLICKNIEPKISEILSCQESRMSHCIMSKVVCSLDVFNCKGIGCSDDHCYSLVISLIKFYVTIRMYFFSNNQNKENLRSNAEAKKKMKEAKLS